MRIQRVTNLDSYRAVLGVLDETCFPSDTPYPKDGADWWIAREGLIVNGFCGLKRIAPTTGFLCRAGVVKPARGSGLHRRMIKLREKYAAKKNINLLVTYVAPHNLKSANNLIKCGYTLYTPQIVWGCANALYFRKQLKKE